MKGPGKVRFPASDCVFVVIRVEKPRDDIPFVLLDNIPLDLRQSATTEDTIGGAFRINHCRFDLHCQLIDRLAHGVVKIFQ
jgi:hypothetical protein